MHYSISVCVVNCENSPDTWTTIQIQRTCEIISFSSAASWMTISFEKYSRPTEHENVRFAIHVLKARVKDAYRSDREHTVRSQSSVEPPQIEQRLDEMGCHSGYMDSPLPFPICLCSRYRFRWRHRKRTRIHECVVELRCLWSIKVTLLSKMLGAAATSSLVTSTIALVKWRWSYCH